jgi:hypothetical protein
MSRFSDDDLRAAFRLRAAGAPRPGLRERIRRAIAQQRQQPTVAPSPWASPIRRVLFRFAATAATAATVALLILAPLAGGLSDAWQRLTAQGAALATQDDGDDDRDDDEDGDDDEGDRGEDDDDDGDTEDDEDDEEPKEGD